MGTITQTDYEPDDELRELLREVLNESTINYSEEQKLDFGEELEGTQRHYRVVYDGFELDGTETISPLGVFVSFEGHLGCAASTVLANATAYGIPTQTYTDEAPPSTIADDPYQDLTAEWYRQWAVREGMPEVRLEQRIGSFDHESIGLGTLERYARVWLSAD